MKLQKVSLLMCLHSFKSQVHSTQKGKVPSCGPDDVVLHAAIDRQDMYLPLRSLHRHEDFLLFSWDFCYQVPVVWIINCQVGWWRASLDNQLSQHRATLTNDFGNGTSIHSIDTWDALWRKPLAETPDAAVVWWFVGIIGNDHTLQMDPQLFMSKTIEKCWV